MHKFSPSYCPLILASLKRRPIMKKINNITTVAAASAIIIINVISFFVNKNVTFRCYHFTLIQLKTNRIQIPPPVTFFSNLCRLHLSCQNNVHCPIPHGVVEESRIYIPTEMGDLYFRMKEKNCYKCQEFNYLLIFE